MLFFAAFGLGGCDSDSDGGGDEFDLQLTAQGIERADQLRLQIKREQHGAEHGPAGLTRHSIDRTIQLADGLLFTKPVRLPASLLPEGEGRVFIHAVALADGVIVGVGDGAAGDGRQGAHRIIVRAYKPACDLDGDTFLDCSNLREECCTTLPADDRPFLADCHDDPARIQSPAEPDVKRREASQAHPFSPIEVVDDYFTCGNGLDDDCFGGDLPCDNTIDRDGDGVPVGDDCDDNDPTIGKGMYDIPFDGIDQSCDGMDGTGTDGDGDGYIVDHPDPRLRDCDDTNPFIHPFRGEIPCNGIDENCSGADLCVDGDLDGDGFLSPEDCNPHDSGIFPGAPEKCGDGIDQNCDGRDDPCPEGDLDGDGFTGEDDCDETNPRIYRGAPEKCGDGIDQDCDGVDLPCPPGGDLDGDGYLPPHDCNDSDPNINPEAAEICNAIDDDCDGLIDEGNPRIGGDGLERPATCGVDRGLCQTGPFVCSQGQYVCLGVEPQEEVCDGFDNDCDGQIDNPRAGLEHMVDEGVTPCGPDNERGACERGLLFCENGALACQGAVTPQPETCNLLDDDCDGRVDEGEGGGGLTSSCFDGTEEDRDQGVCRSGVRRCGDGEFSACEGQILARDELCNEIDDDCDGEIDEDVAVSCYSFDPPETAGRGICQAGLRHCVDGAFGGCDGEVGPELEICDNLDNDCDGRVDQFSQPCFNNQPFVAGTPLLGLCRAGTWVCERGDWGPCNGQVVPVAELCDSRDNDCDGEIDEDFDFSNDPLHCGRCGVACGGGTECCNFACRTLDTVANCGACGFACGADSDDCGEDEQGNPACRCGAGPACLGGLRCDNGQCRCLNNSDCGPDALCCDGECLPTSPENCSECPPPGHQPGQRHAGSCSVEEGLATGCVERRCVCGDAQQCSPGTVCEPTVGQEEFRCVGCANNAQCGQDTICCNRVCVLTNPEVQCEDCGQACDLDVADFCTPAGVNRTCTCGTAPGATPCLDGDVCVRGDRPGEGRCAECRNDDDCPEDRKACVDNVCRRCDPGDHRYCGAQQLCCDFQCFNTNPSPGRSCEACGESCDPDRANRCSQRTCLCGSDSPCEPDSDTPFCNPEVNPAVCVQCRDDGDCANHPNGGQCVNNRCETCDPADHAGCGGQQLCCVSGGRIRCEATAATLGAQCESCNVACNEQTTNRCTGRSCGCGASPPCVVGSDTAVCRDNDGVCVECVVNADCNGRPGGNHCVENRCRQCNPGDHAGCANDQLCCGAGAGIRCEATTGGAVGQCRECSVACGTSADRCTTRDCRCGNNAQCSGATPFCVGGACQRCRNNGDCAANQLCCNNACVATGGGAGDSCTACGTACNQLATNRCDGRTCRCGNLNPCSGGTPVCKGNAPAGLCVECTANQHCSNPNRTQCVADACVQCNPATQAGCNRASASPFCNANNACQACASDAQCAGNPSGGQCIAAGAQAGTCKLCDPADHAGCGGGTPICDAGTFQCRACANTPECPGDQQCVNGSCVGCDPAGNVGCGNPTPICNAANFQCRQCNDNQECGASNQCVDGQCRTCNPANHNGCNNNQVCCNFSCLATNMNRCTGCAAGCDVTTADRCTNRGCRCGASAACSGQTAFCLNAACVNCRDNNDCGGARPQCVGNVCEACNPNTNAGCTASGAAPVCRSVNEVVQCVACTNNADCAGNGSGGVCLPEGRCRACDPGDNDGCNAAGTTPICNAAANPSCRQCAADNECGAQQCVTAGARTGACSACDPADNEGCDLRSATPICAAATATCVACANDGQCAGVDPEHPYCVSGRCEACKPADNTGCGVASTAPICAGNPPDCRACAGDGECTAGGRGQCISGGAQSGSCQACDPTDDAGCVANGTTPVCDADNYQCRACAENGECSANASGPICVEPRCRVCDTATNEGCNPDGAQPICAGATPSCRGCQDSGECGPEFGDDRTCVAGACVRCATDAECAGRLCVANDCVVCADDGACAGHPLGNVCVGGLCGPCVGEVSCAGHPTGEVCAEIGGVNRCAECANSGDCGAEVCVNNACVACQDDPDCDGHPIGGTCTEGECVE